MYILVSATAPTMPSYSSAAATTGTIIFLALLTGVMTASVFARRRPPAVHAGRSHAHHVMTAGGARNYRRARPMAHSRSGKGAVVIAATAVPAAAAVALLAVPVTDRPVAALVLIAAAAAAGAIFGVISFARALRSRRVAAELEHDTVEAWFDAPSLEGFPARALDELIVGISRAEQPRLQTAWLLAKQGHNAAWLAGHFGLSLDVAQLLTDSTQCSSKSPRP